MKKTAVVVLAVFLVSVLFCAKPETQPKTFEGKTGLETNSAVSQETDTLMKKMDALTDGIQ